MTREEAKKRLEVWLICANCPEDKMCYDSHLHSICEYTDYCDEVPIEEAVKVAIEALEQDEYIKVPKKALKYRTAGIVAYNAEWLKNHFDIERAVICGVQEHYEDAISRQAAIDAIYARYIGGKEAVDKAPANDQYAEGIDEAVCAVEDLPPVTPQLKSECEHDHEILKAYSDGANAVLDKVRAEIMNLQTYKMFEGEDAVYVERENVLQIIDEFTAEGSEKE